MPVASLLLGLTLTACYDFGDLRVLALASHDSSVGVVDLAAGDAADASSSPDQAARPPDLMFECAAGHADCNNDRSDGCEVFIASVDVRNCGGCGLGCSVNHIAQPMCLGGICVGQCNPGFLDCNGDRQQDGCETNPLGDANACGGCGKVCSGNNVVAPMCQGGICISPCQPGYSDCNGDKLSDGCESDPLSDVANCGGCKQACSGANVGVAGCTAGKCSGACKPGYADCDGDLRSDGCEVAIATDATNCGGCGSACSNNHIGSPTCAGGLCNGACAPGWADCNNDKLGDGCETDLGDVGSCGKCGVSCSMANLSGAACKAGVCTGTCAGAFLDCNANKQLDGCEVDSQGDAANCGGCGKACSASNVASPSCAGGVCVGVCKVGWADCNANKLTDGCEINVTNAPANCGGCGFACSGNNIAMPTCGGGVCNGKCAANFDDCNANKLVDGCETNLAASAANCGACGRACSGNHVTPACMGGICVGACAVGWSDCNANKLTDGCEVNTLGDVNHCGNCATDCTKQAILSCTNGVCACASPADCEARYADTCTAGTCRCGLGAGPCPMMKACTLGVCH